LNRCYNKLISEFDVLRSRFYLDNSGSPIFSIQPCNINSIEFSEVKDFQKKSNTICEFIDRKFNFEFPPLGPVLRMRAFGTLGLKIVSI